MHVGVIRSKNKKTELNNAVKDYKETALPALATHPANRSGILLVDRENGDTISIAIYDDEASAKAFGPKAEKLLESFKKNKSDARDQKRELFEMTATPLLKTRAHIERG